MKVLRTCLLMLALMVGASLSACRGNQLAGGTKNSTGAVRGETLRIVGADDVDHLDTTGAETMRAYWLFRAFTRQLVSYPSSDDFKVANQVVPDLAEVLPTKGNGGISEDGLTYTFHLKRVRWNTTPPRNIAAGDVVRGFKLICNPVIPSTPSLYEPILGMSAFCDDFSHVPGTVGDIRQFVETHDIDGVRALDEATVVFILQHPASDFLNVLGVPLASPAPVEYLNFLPDGLDFRKHTISDGPYQIVKYIPGREIVLERNPVWEASTDPLRPAYVDRIEIQLGMDEQLTQLQIEAGLADLTFDQRPPVSELASLLEIRNTNLLLEPPGGDFAQINYLVINMVGPNEVLKNVQVRKALEVAVDKTAIVQDWAGPLVARPSRQAALSTGAGYRPGADRYITAADAGDPMEARRLLREAGYPNGISVKLAYQLQAPFPLDAQSIQASLSRAGINVQLIPLAINEYISLIFNPESALRGTWDLGFGFFSPDWYAPNNGRETMNLNFEEKAEANFGRYKSDAVNLLIHRGLEAAKTEDAESAWAEAAAHIMDDAAIVPLVEIKRAWLHSARVRNCLLVTFALATCDINSVRLGNR